MKLVDIDTKITALLWDDEHEEETERPQTTEKPQETKQPTGTDKPAATDKPQETEKSAFTDVTKEAYYYEPVMWAIENGITSGFRSSSFCLIRCSGMRALTSERL